MKMTEVVKRGRGRPPALTSGSTAHARKKVAQLLGGALPKMHAWLDAIAAGIPATDAATGEPLHNLDGSVRYLVLPSPKDAYKAILDTLTFALPRLQNVSVDLASDSFQSLLVQIVGQTPHEVIEHRNREILSAGTEADIAAVITRWGRERTISDAEVVTPAQNEPRSDDRASSEIPAWLLEG
jgi:hypothetical protein